MFIPDPGSGYLFFSIQDPDPDPGVKKEQDPRSGSATLDVWILCLKTRGISFTLKFLHKGPRLKVLHCLQCSRSGILCLLDPWIRDLVPFRPLDLGSGMGKKSGSGSGIRDEQPGSYFQELRNQFFGLEYLNSLMRIQDPGWKKVGSGINISDLQH